MIFITMLEKQRKTLIEQCPKIIILMYSTFIICIHFVFSFELRCLLCFTSIIQGAGHDLSMCKK